MNRQHKIETPALRLTCSLVPWDTEIFGFPVARIDEIQVLNPTYATVDYGLVQEWLDAIGVQLVSCRLMHDRMRESMFLEAHGFRFIEMVLHPWIERLEQCYCTEETITVSIAGMSDIAALQMMAERAFKYERYHADPRLDSQLADKRYGRWVRNSSDDPTQRLLKIVDGDRLIAFFIVEDCANQGIYWHLTAIASEWQGQGYGRRVWSKMLDYHRQEGKHHISTTISARNIPVLNLYASLGFRFQPPQMTFHWVRSP